MSRIAPFLVALFFSLAAAGQIPTPNWESVKTIAPGTEVRIVTSGAKPVRGKVNSVTDNSLVIRHANSMESFPRAEVRSVFVKRERHRLRKVLIGAGVGTAAGLGVGGAAANNCSGIACGGFRMATGGLIGLAGGIVTGLVWSRGEWRQIL